MVFFRNFAFARENARMHKNKFLGVIYAKLGARRIVSAPSKVDIFVKPSRIFLLFNEKQKINDIKYKLFDIK